LLGLGGLGLLTLRGFEGSLPAIPVLERKKPAAGTLMAVTATLSEWATRAPIPCGSETQTPGQ